MPSTSERARIYREMVEDVLAGGLLDQEELFELRDMLARAERRVAAGLAEDPENKSP